MSGLKLCILTLVLFVYLLFGAVVFHFLEQSNESDTRVNLQDVRKRLLGNNTCLTEESLEEFVQAVIMARDSGINLKGNQTSPSNWDFSSSFFFSGTVVTTIGYGNISPSTRSGQGFAIFYAIFGIPLCGLVLAWTGKKVNKKFKSMWAKLNASLDRRELPRWLKNAICIFLGVSIPLGIFIFIPTAVFTAVEGWSFHEAFYYCFITLTTIGFGDFVIGTNPDIPYTVVYKWLAYIWIFLGLVVMATVISMVSDLMEEKAKCIGEKKKGKDGNEEEAAEAKEGTSNGQEKNGHGTRDMELQGAI